jgi:hypothetical protein
VPKAPNKPKPGDKLEKPAAPAASSKGETCKPPYTVDAEGHRHYKVECL